MEKKKRQASQNRVQTTTRNLHHLIFGTCISSAYLLSNRIFCLRGILQVLFRLL